MPVARDAAAVPLALALLARGDSLWVREASFSMLPLIRPGEELQLAPLDSRRVARGALIAYERGAQLVIHRVMAAGGSGVVTKGDALASPDPPVPWGEVAGRVVALRVNGRSVDLTAFPWPLVNRLLAWIASLAARLGLEEAPSSRPRRLAWKALRVPFYLARLLLR